MYREEVRTSKRYTFFDVEFREIVYFYRVFYQQSAVLKYVRILVEVIQFIKKQEQLIKLEKL